MIVGKRYANFLKSNDGLSDLIAKLNEPRK